MYLSVLFVCFLEVKEEEKEEEKMDTSGWGKNLTYKFWTGVRLSETFSKPEFVEMC